VTRYTLTILAEQHAALRKSILRDNNEYGAFFLCGRSRHIDPWTGEVEERFLAKELVEVSPEFFLERTPTKMTWSTTPLYRLSKRAESQDLAVMIAHSHPIGPLKFSTDDDTADAESFEIVFNRLESRRPHLSAVMTNDGALIARAYESDLKPKELALIRCIGDRWEFSYPRKPFASPTELDRQIRAFGIDSTRDLSELRIGIVGCGGTGSAVALLLARIGVRRLVLFDDDDVDETNLNRLHFSTRYDANLHRRKVDTVAEAIASIGLPISIVRVPRPVDDATAREALKSCDIIFGCTDDHLGRNFLNRIAHFYYIPIVDMGLLISPRDQVVGGGYESFDGRVTVVQPGHTCQICRGLIKTDIMLAEALRRCDPEMYQQRRRAGYVVGAPDPSPVVVTFTTEVACMAVNELFQRLNSYRGSLGQCAERVRKLNEVKDTDTIPGANPQPHCKLCGRRSYDGRGDMQPFLDMT
jgi:molybdopterin/thiamine biosynthesis adenylyltransferase